MLLVPGVTCFTYRLLYGQGVPLCHIGTGVALSALAPGPIWLSSANIRLAFVNF